MNATIATLDVVSDVICPWCYIGKHRLVQARKRLPAHIALTVAWKPYELNPGMPAGGVDRATYYTTKFGSEEAAERLLANVTANAEADGLPIDYARIRLIPNTLDAHGLIRLAGESGRQDAVVDALFRAHFVEGRDVGDRSVLRDVGTAAGIDTETIDARLDDADARAAIANESRAARATGIHGVPGFVFNGRYLFSGAQSPETIALSIERAVAKGL